MFKCCVCHGKASRRTSQEDEEDDSESPEVDDDSSSEEEDEEERAIEEELAQKFKCQTPEPAQVVVEVNGDVRDVDRDAIREDVVEILNNAVIIVQEIRREKLEKIKEEVLVEEIEEKILENIEKEAEEAEEAEEAASPDKVESDDEGEYEIVDDIKRDGLKIEEMIIEELINEEEADNDQELKEIIDTSITSNGSQLPPPESDEQDESTPAPFVEIVDEIKKTEIRQIDGFEEIVTTKEEEQLEIIELTYPEEKEEQQKQQQQHPQEVELEEEEEEVPTFDAVNGDLLNIPPPEEVEDSEKLSAELDFPTPPPIDFDVDETPRKGPPVPPWDEETTPPPPPENLLPSNFEDSKPSSPGSKSLPSPPSSASDTGNETEAESKSSSDEQRTAKLVACLTNKTSYIERTIDDVDDADDSVFEAISLANDPEIKEIPPRPVPPVPRWLSQEEDEQESNGSEVFGGMQEPPATPVARDELALRRRRFFSDLLQAARSAAEHRVSFDPLGPLVHPGCEHDDREEHLEELVNRLENVTKRLEQVSVPQPTVQTQEIAVQTKSPSPERSLSLTEELPPSESSQSSSSSRESTVSGASVVEVVKSMSVAGYEDILAGPVQEYLALSQKIGGDVAAHSKLVDKAFQIQLQYLKTAASRPAPTNQSEQVSLLGPTSTHIQEIQEYREKHRGSPFFNHLSAISESIPALGWVAVSPTPAPYVKEMNDAGQFYTNRVLKDWKEKDKTHVEWCKAWVKTLTDLQQFVRQHHTTGLVWAKTGTVPAGGIPPPPPPCMMPIADPAPVINDDRSALFAEINQGENITKNLKKVTSDMQTHKNTNLRTGPAPFKAPVVSNNLSPMKTTLPANAPIDKPPVFTRDGKKWLVEYHKGNKNLVIDNVEMNNVVYMFRCQDSSLVIKGKINSVVMDSCRKSAVVVDSVVASIEFVNCQSVQMQVLGKVPTISIDKTDGCQMFLNNDTLDVELITSKSSEMNVMVPVANNDYTEYPVPEQFKTVITKNGLSTVAVDSLG